MSRRRGTPGTTVLACLLCALLSVTLAACTVQAGATGADGPVSHAGASDDPSQPGVAAPKYVALATRLAQHGVGVWVETDLVAASQAGEPAYRRALSITLDLARRPGVRGIKIADELGYHDGTDTSSALALLRRARTDIRAALPDASVLVDVVVPELGCLGWTKVATHVQHECSDAARAGDPGASLGAVDRYVASGAIDVLDLSAGLRDESWYAAQGTTRDDAMRAAWREAVRRWGSRVRLQARKALAHPGSYTLTPAEAEADVHTFVDIPLSEGAAAVDIWTWAQRYHGVVVHLTDPGGVDNALTRALEERRKKGAQLWTHMSPSTLQVDLDHDVAAASRLFDAVLVAAGTG
ncbi:hypothetical protein FHX52_2776 [Humibacillus xanthopallidus]|uniref:Uncharacterized protein n=1 Tax=Humibacillus xanthopallidus TaxID=412689 RepID=A0A543PPQ9_9MICO|nr:hypothetical protein [Humibacillus xanthopallidus]TQN46070.1 hypothetical protein FHX52_2776 [Humibacillus xanthopallidus]